MSTTERAVLAGGCFWGMQDLIRKMNGVVSTRVGYSGGDVPNATYRNHGTHAEAIEIVFDPAKLSYRELLEFFFQIHDPTTRNRQGNDIGHELPLGDLLHQRRAEARRRGHDRRRECIEVCGRARSSPRWRRPARSGKRSRSTRTICERIPNGYTCHFVPAELEAACQAEANRISSKLRSLRRFEIRD